MDWQPHEHTMRLHRPQGCFPPDHRRLDASYALNQESLESIIPEQWLDDRIVNTFINYLCAALPGRSHLIDSTALEVLRDMREGELNASETQTDRDQIDELYKPYRILAATVKANDGLVFMPFCVEDHWILAVADLQYRIIRVYDSLVSCDSSGKVTPGSRVDNYVLPIVKRILSFCHYENKWAVEHMWLPIQTNHTECGVYICLMALQHSYKRRFTHFNYVESFRDENGHLIPYELEESYWLAGRRIILQVCSRFLKPAWVRQRASQVEFGINNQLRELLGHLQVPQTVDGFNNYHEARLSTLRHVRNALSWFIMSIEELGSSCSVRINEGIQRRTRDVVLTPSGEPFRNEIVEKAINYAWHDVPMLITLRHDLIISLSDLTQEIGGAHVRLSSRPAWEAQLSLVGVPTGQSSSISDISSPSSAVPEDARTES